MIPVVYYLNYFVPVLYRTALKEKIDLHTIKKKNTGYIAKFINVCNDE